MSSVSSVAHADTSQTAATSSSGGTKPAETYNSNASRSSGERGMGGVRLFSEKAHLSSVAYVDTPQAAAPFRRNQASGSAQFKRQPLFGREGSGGRGASLREAASPPRISRISLFFCKFDNQTGEEHEEGQRGEIVNEHRHALGQLADKNANGDHGKRPLP